MVGKITHTRVEKEILRKAQRDLPDFESKEIFKAGYQFLKGLETSGKFIYGKNVWEKFKKK